MKTRKNHILFHSIVLVLLSLALLVTCKAGLGESVDTTPPKLSIAYPPSNSIIRDWFIMGGLAEDETYVKSVTVVLKGKETHTFNAVVDKEKKQWTLEVNKPSGGKYPLKDGKYDVTVTAIDSANRKASSSVTYYIDNTPPILVLTRPSTRGKKDGSSVPFNLLDPYGEIIKFTGNWWDANSSEGAALSIHFFKEDEDGVTPVADYETTIRTQNFDLEIAQGTSGGLWEALEAACEVSSLDSSPVATAFTYTISLQDDAKVWQSPDQNAPTNPEGNTTKHYYINRDITANLGGGSAPSFRELSAHENGDVSVTIPEALKAKLKDIQIPAAPIPWEETMGKFTFDPENKSPSISIVGMENYILSGSVPEKDENTVSALPSFNIKIEPNKDKISINEDEIKITLTPYNSDGTSLSTDPGKIKETTKENGLKTGSIGEVITVNYDVDETNGSYCLDVSVADTANNRITQRYGFTINDGAPQLKSISPDRSPNETKINTSGNKFTVFIKGEDGGDNVSVKVAKVVDNTATEITNGFNVVSAEGPASIGNGKNEFSWELSFENAPGEGEEVTYRFWLYDGTYTSNRRDITFLVDNTPPALIRLDEPRLITESGHAAEGKSMVNNSTINVKGYASEDLEAAVFYISKEGEEPSSDLSLWKEGIRGNNTDTIDGVTAREFTATLSLASFGFSAEGSYTLWARFADDTFNKDLQNYGAATELIDVIYDEANPTFTEDDSGISGTALAYRNADVAFGGDSTDGNGIASVVVTYKKNGGEPVTLLNQTDGATSWSTSLQTNLGDGTYELEFIATDNVGKSTSFTRNVMIDTTAPTLDITAPSSGEAVGNNSYTIRGTVDDGTGKGVSTLEYSLDNTNWIEITKAAAWSKTGVDFSGGGQGEKTLWVRASDGLNDAVIESVSFQYDTENPTLGETDINTTNTVAKKELFSLAVTAQDSNALKSLKITQKKEDGTSLVIYEDNDLSGTEKTKNIYDLPKKLDNGDLVPVAIDGTEDGIYSYQILAKDITGKEASLTRTVRFDTIGPKIELDAFTEISGSDPTRYLFTSVEQIGAMLSDESGIKTATMEITAHPDGFSGSLPSPTIPAENAKTGRFVQKFTGLIEGEYTLKLTTTDSLDQATTETIYIAIDNNNPSISANLSNNQFRSSSFNLVITASDSAGLKGAPTATVLNDVTGVSISIPSKNGNDYTYTISIPNPESFTATEVTIRFTAEDIYGKTSDFNFIYKIDLSPPVFTEINYPASDFINLPDNYTYRITGKASDVGSGLKDVRYAVLSGDTAVVPEVDSAEWLSAAGLDNWTATVDLTGKARGKYSLFVMLRDEAGNVKTSERKVLYVDADLPTISLGTVKNLYNASFNIDLTASDPDDNLHSVTAKVVNGGDLTVTHGGGNSYSVAVPAGEDTGALSDGPKSVEITAKDKSGKQVTETVTFTLDTQAPTISFTNLTGAAVNEGTSPSGYIIESKLTGANTKVLGMYEDLNSGLIKLDYTFERWNGTAWVGSGTKTDTKTASTMGSFSEDISTYLSPDKDGIWRVKLIATDKAGNESSAIYSPIFIADKTAPTVTITDFGANSTKQLKDAITISGAAFDTNGGELEEVEIIISHPDYTSEQKAANKKIIPKNEMTENDWSWIRGDGDNSPFIYSGDYTITAIAYDTAGNIREATARVSCDTTPPAIQFARPYSLLVKENNFHGPSVPKQNDIYPIQQTGTLAGEVIVQGTIPSTEFNNKAIYYQVGGSLKVTRGSETIEIADEWYTELNEVAGSGAITAVEIIDGYLTDDTVTDPANTGLTGTWVTKNEQWSFSFTIDTPALMNSGKLYQTPGTNSDTHPNLQTVNIYVAAIDSAGNLNIAVYPINLDTDTDKPTVGILSPEVIGEAADLGGSFTVSGNVHDDNFIYNVYMQVEVVDGNYVDNVLTNRVTTDAFTGIPIGPAGVTDGQSYLDGDLNTSTVRSQDFTSDVDNYFARRDTWYKVSYTSTNNSWKIKLNSDGEFFNTALKDFYKDGHYYNEADMVELKIRVMAVDSKAGAGIISSTSVEGNYKEITVRIDGDNPGIVFDEFPEPNSYISGQVPIKITFTDNESVVDFSLKAGNNTIFSSTNLNGFTQTGNTGDPQITVEGTIDSTTLGTQTTFTVEVEDNNIPPRKSSTMRTVYIDNNRPTDALFGVLQPADITTDPPTPQHRDNDYLVVSTTEALIAGKASDIYNGIEGSGIKHIIVYFTKGSGDSTRIFETAKRSSGGAYVKDTTGTLLTNQISVDVHTGGGNYAKQNIYFPVESLNAINPNKDATLYNIDATPYAVIDTPEGGSDGDGDRYRENLKANKAWYLIFDSTRIKDGLYDINYLIVDNAGNATYYKDQMLVQNNPPEVASLVLATDINGDSTVLHNATGTAGEEDFIYPGTGSITGTTVDATDFTIVNSKFSLRVNVLDGTGNGDLTYFLEYPRTTGGPATISNDTGIFEIPSFGNDTITASNTSDPALYKVWVKDSVEPGISLTSEEITAKVHVDNIDDIVPTATFYEFNTKIEKSGLEELKKDGTFVNKTLGSLFKTGSPAKVTGHVEPRGESKYDGDDPDLSGQVILRGNVSDNQRITSISLVLDGGTAIEIASAGGDGRLQVVSGQEANAKVSDTIGLDGHHAEWSYIWNTRTIVGVAKQNVSIQVQTKDASDNTNVAASYTNPSTEFNSTTVDVVPYITKISTTKRTTSGLKDDNIRSSSGKYSIIKGTDTSFISVEGFNLNPGATGVRIVNTGSLAGATATSGSQIAHTNIASDYTSFSLTNDVNNSGYLEVFVNGVRSVNNINDNGLESNQEPNLRAGNYLLNDDRYLRFFDMKDTQIKNGYYPTMIMEGNDPVFGYINYAGGPNRAVGLGAGTGAGSYMPSHAMPQRAKFNGTTAAEMTTEYLIKASIWDQMGMARDEGGRYHHITVYNRDGGAMSYLYDRYAELYTDGMGWGTGTGYSNYNGDWSEDANNNAITLETVNFGNGLLLGRYQYPKLIAKGNSIGGAAQIYALYYDDNTTNRDLIFRNFRVGSTVTGTGTATLYGGGTSSTGENYNQRSNLADNNTSGRITAATSASRHFDYGVTSDNRVVIVYFDETAGQLKLRYSNAAVDGSSPTAAVAWTTSSVTFPDYVGNYVSMQIDSDGGIHIAALDTADSDLSYMYLAAYNSTTLKHVTVDAANSVGNWTQLKIKETGSGANKEIFPYIAYYNSSETGSRDSIKLAYVNSGITSSNVPEGVDANGEVTGGWESMTVPAISPPQGGGKEFQNVCLDFDSAGNPVVGYLGNNLEWGKWLNEQ